MIEQECVRCHKSFRAHACNYRKYCSLTCASAMRTGRKQGVCVMCHRHGALCGNHCPTCYGRSWMRNKRLARGQQPKMLGLTKEHRIHIRLGLLRHSQTVPLSTAPYAGRQRAKHLYPEKLPCDACGSNHRVARHHIDENTNNNVRTNIQFLCGSCHNRTHFVSPREKRQVPLSLAQLQELLKEKRILITVERLP